MGTSLCRARSESSMLMTDTSSGTRILRSVQHPNQLECNLVIVRQEGGAFLHPVREFGPGSTPVASIRPCRSTPVRESVTVSPASSMALQISQITLSALSVVQLQDCPDLLMPLVNQISHGLVGRVRIIQRYMRCLQLRDNRC